MVKHYRKRIIAYVDPSTRRWIYFFARVNNTTPAILLQKLASLIADQAGRNTTTLDSINMAEMLKDLGIYEKIGYKKLNALLTHDQVVNTFRK